MDALMLIEKIQKITEEHGNLEIITTMNGFGELIAAEHVKPIYYDIDNTVEWNDEEKKQNAEEFQAKLITNEIKQYILVA